MIRVMIADDEEYEREYLRNFFNSNYSTVAELVYEAKDGAELIEKALELYPQIILMDIRMPKIDGLEAARQLRKKLPAAELVIISAYGQFSYAQKAIRLGVKDYLVKPYLDEELRETLNKLISRMNIKDHGTMEPDRENENDELYADVEGEIVWKLAFNNKINAVKMNDLQMRGINEDHYKCLVLSHGSIRNMGSAGCEIVKNLIALPHTHTIINYMFGQMIIYLFFADDISYSQLNSSVKKVREYLGGLDESPIYCGVSGTYSELDSSRAAFEEARSYIADYSDPRFRAVFFETLTDISEIQELIVKLAFAILGRSQDSVKEYSDSILGIISRNDKSDSRIFEDERRILLSVARKINYQSGKRILSSAAIEVCRICDMAIESDAAGEGSADRNSDAKACPALEEGFTLQSVWYKAIEILETSADENAVTGNPVIVKKTKEYIEKNYYLPISQQSAADELKVSPGYIRKNYRLIEGVSFTEYLLTVRLNKSKEFIREGRYSLAEISEMVGFSNPGYFSRCFKKEEGILPSEYEEMFH